MLKRTRQKSKEVKIPMEVPAPESERSATDRGPKSDRSSKAKSKQQPKSQALQETGASQKSPESAPNGTSTVVWSWQPQPSETAEINKLIAESMGRPVGPALRERRKSKEKMVNPDAGSPKKAEAFPVEASEVPPKEDVSIPTKEEILGQPPKPVPPSPAAMRWKNAGLAVMSTQGAEEDAGDGESSQAKLYKLLNLQTQTKTLTGAAARGARAAAFGRIKAASAAVGGKFLSGDEYEAMKYEMRCLREQNKRLEQHASELRQENSRLRAQSQAAADIIVQVSDGGSPMPDKRSGRERSTSSSLLARIASPFTQRPPRKPADEPLAKSPLSQRLSISSPFAQRPPKSLS